MRGTMRILIIDNSKRTLAILRRYLEDGVSQAVVTEFDPAERGKPDHAFEWSAYDVALIDQDLGGAGTGIEWLREFGRRPDFPASILIMTRPDPSLAAAAAKAGAHRAASKRELTAASLSDLVQDASGARHRTKNPQATPGTLKADKHVLDGCIDGLSQFGEDSTYRIYRLIGQGAMSRVYLGERIEDGLTVVVKLLDGTLTQDTDIVQRFMREASIVSGIDSPYVVQIYGHGFSNQHGFIAMEFFSRGDLKQRLDNGISPNDALIYMVNIARGLDAIHDVGIIHRDLKPANIMFRADESMAVGDFGISKRLGGTTQLTMTGGVVGTPFYMSPEQANSQPVDARSDLYSAGVILFEMLTGRKPFTGDSLEAVFYQHSKADVPSLPGALAHLQPVIDRLMAKNPKDRYGSAIELVVDLQPYVDAA